MSTFMEVCCCGGKRPESSVSQRHYSRPDLIARLLRDRSVARLVVAPTGFGKSFVILEYADVVFAFRHVFWVNAASPCFLRDLDAGTLLSDLLAADPEIRLAVFEDLPRLDGERAEKMSALIDRLLERRVEVIASCTPSADTLSSLQRDRLLVRGADLLLDDDEMLVEELEGRLAKGWDVDDLTCRIACLRWGEKGLRALLLGIRAEEMPDEIRLALLTLLVMGEGMVDDVRLVLRPGDSGELASLLEQRYPFLGIDLRRGTYRCVEAGAELLAETLCARFGELVHVSRFDGNDELCCYLADVLTGRGRGARACELVGRLASKTAGANWLARQAWRVIADGEPRSVVGLCEATRRGFTGRADEFAALRAWALMLLGETSAALSAASRVVRSGSAGVLSRMRAATLLVRYGAEGGSSRTWAEAERLLESRQGHPEGERPLSREVLCCWLALGSVARACAGGLREALEAWRCAYEDALGDAAGEPGERMRTALLLAGAWVLEDCAAAGPGAGAALLGSCEEGLAPDGGAAALPEAMTPSATLLLGFVVQCIEDEAIAGRVSWPALCAGNALERMRASGLLAAAPLSHRADALARRREVALVEQREEHRRAGAAREREKDEYRRTHPDSFREDGAASTPRLVGVRSSIPVLNVTLFGGMEVRIGTELADSRLMNRQKSKTLLAMLVLSKGREMSKDRLAEILWPESELALARKNYYSVWSQLKQALRPAGEMGCPYLIRTNEGYRLDSKLVTSDVFSFDGLCRSLVFGQNDSRGWESLYARVCDDYAEDLMPYERDNEFICALRERFRTQLVDGLIAASSRLVRLGEVRGSLWFAREAMRRDSRREDSYIALMEAQIASDQRAAALDTYFSCRRFLSQELGIDPSLSLVNLYRSIIETEEML